MTVLPVKRDYTAGLRGLWEVRSFFAKTRFSSSAKAHHLYRVQFNTGLFGKVVPVARLLSHKRDSLPI
jgi:hypothetical protein